MFEKKLDDAKHIVLHALAYLIPSPSRGGLGVQQGFQATCRLLAERLGLATLGAPCKGGWVKQSAEETHPHPNLPLEGEGVFSRLLKSCFAKPCLHPLEGEEVLSFLHILQRLLILSALSFVVPHAHAQAPQLSPVVPGKQLQFPHDFGAHPDFRTEWWYATGWLQTPDGKPLGFQITFFRSATDHDVRNPSAFAPRQLIIAHAAISDPQVGRLLHAENSAREGFGLAYAKEGNTDVKLDDWTMTRDEQGRYRVHAPAREFTLELTLSPTQPVLLQGKDGYSRKGPKPEQSSYYYSEPHLQVAGSITRDGKPVAVTGSAWLDHEWSTTVLDERALGWDWIGINLDGGAALTAFRIRGKDGSQLWAYVNVREADGSTTQYGPNQVKFIPHRNWRSPRTQAVYPVEMTVEVTNENGSTQWRLLPLQDDQELDSRSSTGAVYWEGAVTVYVNEYDNEDRNKKIAGRGYLEMTGYVSALKL